MLSLTKTQADRIEHWKNNVDRAIEIKFSEDEKFSGPDDILNFLDSDTFIKTLLGFDYKITNGVVINQNKHGLESTSKIHQVISLPSAVISRKRKYEKPITTLTSDQHQRLTAWSEQKDKAIEIKSSEEGFKGKDSILNELSFDEFYKALILNSYRIVDRTINFIHYPKTEKTFSR